MKKLRWVLSVLIIAGLVCAGTVFAAANEDDEESSIDPQAMTVLMKMADFLAKAKSFSVTVDGAYDAVQEDGRKLEYGGVRKVLVDRPNRMRQDIEQRDGGKSVFIFNGKEIYAFNAKNNVYGTVEKPGSIDAAVKFFTDDLGMRLPLAQLYSVNLPKYVKDKVRVLDLVGTAMIDGVSCDHLSARMDNADVQLWIDRGQNPVPRRIIVTYRNAPDKPQFRAQLKDWNFAPSISDSLFTFTPPEGAERIAFAAAKKTVPPKGDQKGDQQ